MGCAPSKEGATVTSGDTQRANGSQSRSSGATKSILREAVESGSYSKMASYKPDPRCPLTERQLYSITKSWKAINREMASTAVNMFVRLLEVDGMRSFFSKFKDHKTVAELRASKVFETHALMVISVIDDVITNLDDMDYVISLLEATGESHSKKFGNLNADFLWNVEEPFLWAIRETLGDRYTISIENIYTITIRYILQALHDSFTKHRQGQTTAETETRSNEKQAEVEDTIGEKDKDLPYDRMSSTEIKGKYYDEEIKPKLSVTSDKPKETVRN